MIYAYGVRDNVDYTLFRPFNWIGPKLDDVFEPKEGSSRLFTQFISNVIFKKPLQLVDGGKQSRSFTFIDDGVDALLRIIENKDGSASRQIFNIGNPRNDVSVARAREADHRGVQGLSRLRRARQGGEGRGGAVRQVFRQVLPGHPEARALDREREEAARLDRR